MMAHDNTLQVRAQVGAFKADDDELYIEQCPMCERQMEALGSMGKRHMAWRCRYCGWTEVKEVE